MKEAAGFPNILLIISPQASSVTMPLQRLQRLFFSWPHTKTFGEYRLRVFQIAHHSVELVLGHDLREIVVAADGVPPAHSYLLPIGFGLFCVHSGHDVRNDLRWPVIRDKFPGYSAVQETRKLTRLSQLPNDNDVPEPRNSR